MNKNKNTIGIAEFNACERARHLADTLEDDRELLKAVFGRGQGAPCYDHLATTFARLHHELGQLSYALRGR